jgi:hypothetical protein
MRLPYVNARLQEAVAAISADQGDIRDRLYAAHLRLHTVLPEDFPVGEMRQAYQSIHDRLTKRTPRDPHETGVVETLAHLDDHAAGALGDDLRVLAEAVAQQIGAAVPHDDRSSTGRV